MYDTIAAGSSALAKASVALWRGVLGAFNEAYSELTLEASMCMMLDHAHDVLWRRYIEGSVVDDETLKPMRSDTEFSTVYRAEKEQKIKDKLPEIYWFLGFLEAVEEQAKQEGLVRLRDVAHERHYDWLTKIMCDDIDKKIPAARDEDVQNSHPELYAMCCQLSSSIQSVQGADPAASPGLR